MSEPSLEYFVAIGEELNISRAAAKLHISQQSLSTYLAKLEDYYGTQLFIRKPTPALTEAGSILWECGRHCLSLKRSTYRNIRNLAKAQNTISLGIYAPNGSMLMSFIPLLEFNRSHPDITFNVSEEKNRELRQKLSDRELDLIISAYNPAVSFPNFEIIDLYANTEYIIITDDLLHQYFPDQYPDIILDFSDGIRLEQFSHVPVVLPDASTGFSNVIHDYCRQNQIQLTVAAEISNRYLSNTMMFDGVAFGFCDRRYLNHMQNTAPSEKMQNLHSFPVIDPPITNHVAIMYRKDESHSAAFRDLVEMIRRKNDLR